MLAKVEQLLTHDKKRRGNLKDYALVSVLAVSGYYLTNWALLYLNYATRVVFKSCKVGCRLQCGPLRSQLQLQPLSRTSPAPVQVLPVMAVGAAVHGRRYSAGHYGSALALVTGVALFTLGASLVGGGGSAAVPALAQAPLQR